MSTSSGIAWLLAFVLAYLVAPTALVWGWIRYVKSFRQSLTFFSMLSLLGFFLASASASYGLCVVLYSLLGGFGTGSLNYAPDYESFYRCVRNGGIASLSALAFALAGVWGRSALRWQSLASALGTLAFWLVATTWP